MQQIIIQPRNQEEFQLVMQLMKRMKIKTEVVVNETPNQKKKREILDSIERGLVEIKLHQEGKITLKTAQQVLDEL